MEIPLFIENNHLMARLSPDPWIIDTGSPVSFSTDCRILPIGQTRHTVRENFKGYTMEKLREQSGLTAIGLLGNDILAKYHVGFFLADDERHSVVHLSEIPLRPSAGAQRLGVSIDHEVPVINASIGITGPQQVIFDTGARISYVADKAMLTGSPIRKARDFIPGHGEFEVDVHLLNVRLGGIETSLEFTHHPEASRKMALAQSSAIIGWEILRRKPVLYQPSLVEIWA